MHDEVTLTLGDRIASGWTDIRISRGIERLPSDFQIAMTELYPGEDPVVVAEPGMPCVVKIGDAPVITGYVDRYIPSQ